MKTNSFDFFLPRELIAQSPHPVRDKCRLMALHKNGSVDHKSFSDIIHYLSTGDLLIFNDTKVIPAHLVGIKPSGSRLDIVLTEQIGDKEWKILSKGSYSGKIEFSDSLSAFIEDGRSAIFYTTGDVREKIDGHGKMPLPPYIKRESTAADRGWYQTVFAKKNGSIAAPTAGLHFTAELIRQIEDIGILTRFITLHVGTGTFLPVKTDDIENHSMHREYFELDESLFDDIKKVKASGGKIIAVGTTTTRAVEGCLSNRCTVTNRNGNLSGFTDIFIFPGYAFKAIDCLITNFHLPRSTPILLTAALSGRENLLKAYAEAVSKKYRFFSYGDAMLIL